MIIMGKCNNTQYEQIELEEIMMLIALIIVITITILLFVKVVNLDHSNDMKSIEIRNLEIKVNQLEHISKDNNIKGDELNGI